MSDAGIALTGSGAKNTIMVKMCINREALASDRQILKLLICRIEYFLVKLGDDP
ncbi:MAG: hypothetical protein QGH93_07460 [Gammaproteobacteria bacterium]|nr:hypothetical protein [Gammaproteobacteria bacterium]